MTDSATGTATTGTAPSADRLFWLDNLRTFLTALVLLHHCAATYSHIPVWTYVEAPHDDSAYLLDVLLAANQTWFMGLFFLISGYFVPSAVDRHGVAGFLRGRLMRLGVPLVLFVVLLRPLFVLPAWLAAPHRGAFWSSILVTTDPGPLWFLLVLLAFGFGYAALRAIGDDREPLPRSRVVVRFWAVAALGVGLGLATYVWRFLTPDGTYWPVVGLPTPSYLPQYLLCFVFGCVAARRQWLHAASSRVGAGSAVLAVPTFLAYLLIITRGDANGGPGWAALGAAVTLSTTAAFTVTAVLVAFRRFASRTGRIRKWLSNNAFAAYVIHAPVLALLGMALAGWSALAAVKALGLFVLGASACWLLAAAIRRVPGARRVF